MKKIRHGFLHLFSDGLSRVFRNFFLLFEPEREVPPGHDEDLCEVLIGGCAAVVVRAYRRAVIGQNKEGNGVGHCIDLNVIVIPLPALRPFPVIYMAEDEYGIRIVKRFMVGKISLQSRVEVGADITARLHFLLRKQGWKIYIKPIFLCYGNLNGNSAAYYILNILIGAGLAGVDRELAGQQCGLLRIPCQTKRYRIGLFQIALIEELPDQARFGIQTVDFLLNRGQHISKGVGWQHPGVSPLNEKVRSAHLPPEIRLLRRDRGPSEAAIQQPWICGEGQ